MNYNVSINVSSQNNSNVDVSVNINNVKQQKQENNYEEQQQDGGELVPSTRSDATDSGNRGGQCTLRTPALGGGIPPIVSTFTDNLGPGLHIRF